MRGANSNSKAASLQKWALAGTLLLFVAGLSSWTYYRTIVPMGPYPLVYPANFGNRINVPDDNPTTRQGVYLGRLLFYEPLLSINNKLSCGSCHKQELAFTDGQAFSVGADRTNTPRNAMPLVNLLWERKFFWDGRSSSLEGQAAIPMQSPHEMGQMMQTSAQKLRRTAPYPELFKAVFGDEGITGPGIIKAIAQFERTLISANSKYDQYLRNAYKPSALELQGMVLFERAPQPGKGIRGANCARCHGGVKNYMELFHNNGLDSLPKDAGVGELTGLPGDQGRFKVPTLRNIALTAPYMHDGRFKTLDEVLDHYSSHIRESAALSPILRGESNVPNGQALMLRPDEQKAIVAFLNMLTDNDFIHDPRFADPHLNSTTIKN